MIKEKEMNFRISNNMLSYYKEKLKMDLFIGQIIKINIDELSNGSHCNITAICDNCGNEKIMMYKTYYHSTKNKSEKYFCKKCSSIKIQETLYDRYGYKHALQCDEFKIKSKNTLMKNYGVDHPSKSNIIKERFNKTMIKRYGVKNALENETILSNMMNKTFEQYGMYYVETNEFKEKSKKTCIDKYDKEYYMDTNIFRIKSKNSSMIKYNVEYPIQNKEIFDKAFISSLKMKKYKGTELYYQGSYEKDFLDLCSDLNILDKIKRGCCVKYNIEDKELVYFPDFYIEEKNLLVEIKSLYWYNKHKDRNILKENKCKELGFNYLMIMNKKYDEFLRLI